MKKIYFLSLLFIGFLILSAANVQAQAQSAPCFVAKGSGLYGTDADPVGVTVADFDADGIPDIATINSSATDVNIFLGTGRGDTLAYPAISPTINLSGLTPVAITSGNFNGDQYMDIAVAGYVAGSGTYAAYVYIYYTSVTNVPPQPETLNFSNTSILLPTPQTNTLSGSLTAADFDRDKLQDIVVTSYNDNETYLLLSGNGNNFNASSIPGASGIGAWGVTSGYFNADTIPDIAVGTYVYNGSINILLGGNTSNVVSFSNGGVFNNTSVFYDSYIQYMTTGDFNGDGYIDLAASGGGSYTYVLLNSNNGGIFNPPSVYYLGNNSTGITTGKFNGDSYTDIAVSYPSNSIGILVSSGAAGTFSNTPFSFIATTDVSGPSLTGIAAGDFNKDNKSDIVVVNGGFNDLSLTLNHYLSLAPSISGLARQYCSSDANAYTLKGFPLGGTFSGNGMNDTVFVPVLASSSNDQFSAVSYAYNDTNGCTYYAYDTTSIVYSQASANSNFNLTPAYFADQEQDTLLMYPSGGTFSGPGISSDTFSIAGYSGYTAVIFTPKAGIDSIIYTYNNTTLGCSSTDTMVTQVYGSAEASAKEQANTQPLCLSLPSNYINSNNGGNGITVASIATGDFNGDGKIDVAAADNYNGNIDVFTNYVQGGFNANVSSFNTQNNGSYTYPTYVVKGYFDNDTLLDLASLGSNEGPDAVDIFINQSTATTISFNDMNHYYTGGSGPYGLVSADFNNDGFTDIATLENYSPSISILTNDSGKGFVDTNTIYLIPSGPPTARVAAALQTQSPSYTIGNVTGITTGDFNNDKYIDFAVSGYANSGIMPVVVIVLNDKQNNFYVDTTIGIQASTNVYASAITTGDFNGDKQTDIAITGAIGCPNCREQQAVGPPAVVNSYLYILLNTNNSSSFTINGFSSSVIQPNNIISLDLNRDGIADLLTANGDGSNDGTYEAYVGDGRGNFADASPPNNLIGSLMGGLASADFNNDGKPDFVIGENYYSNTTKEITVLLNDFEKVSIAGLDSAYCPGSLPIKLFGSPSGGSFAKTSGITTTGGDSATFKPVYMQSPAYTHVNYTYTNIGGCTFTVKDSIKVYPPDTVTLTGLQKQYCINTRAVSTLTGHPAGGIFYDPVVSGSIVTQAGQPAFSISDAGLGIHDVIYAYKNPVTGCITRDTATTDVFNSSSVFLTGVNPYYCTSSPNVTLTGFPSGGKFSGPGVTGNVFSPSSVAPGTYPIIYTYTDATNCSGSDTIVTTVYQNIPLSVSGLDSSYCINSNPVTLTANPVGGIFSAPGAPVGIVNSSSNVFYPSIAGAGKHAIIYYYRDSVGCSNKDTLYTTVNNLPSVHISGVAASYCANAIPATLTGNPAGGIFSGLGNALSGNTFNPAGAGVTGEYDIVYSYTDANSCSNTDTAKTTIVALPSLNINGAKPDYCTHELADTISGYPRGGTLAVFGGSYNSIVSATDSGSFIPTMQTPTDSSESGYILYSYTDGTTGCSNTDTMNFTIYLVPKVVFSATPICYSASPAPLIATAYPAGGTFTYSGSGITTSPVFDPSQTGIGVFPVTCQYSVNSCTATYTDYVNVQKPSAHLRVLTDPVSSTLRTDFCSNEGTMIIADSVGNGTYSYSSVGIFNSMGNGQMSFNTSAASPSGNIFNYSFIDNTYNCSVSVAETLNVHSTPAPTSPTITAQTLVCSSHALEISASSSTTGVSYWWTKSGKPSFTSSDTIIANSAVSDSGWYDVKVSKAFSGFTCYSPSDSVHIVVKQSPVIKNFTHPVTSNVCDFNGTTLFLAAEGGHVTYNWYLNNVKISDQHDSILYIGTAGVYKLGVTDTNVCVTYDSFTVSSNPQRPVISVQGSPLDSLLISSSAASYQWYVNNKKIIGATSQQLSIGYNGTYSVLATYQGNSSCKEFSLPYTVNRYDLISISRVNSQTDSTIIIPPHGTATSGIVIKYDDASKTYYVEYTPVQDEVITIIVTAMTGEVLWKREVKAQQWQLSSTPINVSNLASAMYILNATTQEQSQYKKIIVE